ncbi:MAG: hypothetical protein MK200_04820 [Nitrosopumilus sp.]|nr:hypothetical protein [Nitrosopumilus sp.]
MNLKMGIKMKEHDWVDSDNHIIDRNSLINHTDQYIRQLLTATFDEFIKRKKERKKRKELVKSITKIENDWGMI